MALTAFREVQWVSVLGSFWQLINDEIANTILNDIIYISHVSPYLPEIVTVVLKRMRGAEP